MNAPSTTRPERPPQNGELEQALLGAILISNDAFHQVSAFLAPHHFFEPVHRKIFEIVGDLIRVGKRASPITLKTFLPPDLVVAENMTASQYLARLVAEATTVLNAHDYGRLIYDLAAQRKLIDIGEALIAAAHNRGTDHTAHEIAADAVETLAELAAGSADREGTMRSVGAAVADFIGHISALYQGTAADDSISTGLRDVDERIGGLKRGTLVVMAGRPGMGKTTLAGVMVRNAARRGHGVAFFSLEMPTRQIMPRMLADAMFDAKAMSVDRMAKAKFDADEFDHIVDAAKEFERLPLVIDDTPAATVGTLLAKTQTVASKFKRQGSKLDLVVVDYLKFVSASDRYGGQRHYEVGEVTAGLKQLARRLDCVVLLCAQLNRQVEQRQDRRPQLSDLRESGDIEADADLVLLLYREAYYLASDADLQHDAQKIQRFEQVERQLEIIVAKNRFGPTVAVPTYINLEHSAVRDLGKQGDLAFDRGPP
jgi:replicative DNA helicase